MDIDTSDKTWRPIQTSSSRGWYHFGELTRFVNTRTGAIVITRDVAVYRRLPEWSEWPLERRSP